MEIINFTVTNIIMSVPCLEVAHSFIHVFSANFSGHYPRHVIYNGGKPGKVLILLMSLQLNVRKDIKQVNKQTTKSMEFPKTLGSYCQGSKLGSDNREGGPTLLLWTRNLSWVS